MRMNDAKSGRQKFVDLLCLHAGRLTHSGVFLVGFQIEPEQEIVMGNPLHVLYVVRQSMQWEKADEAKYFHGRLLLADELGFHLFKAKLACDINDFRDECFGETAPAELRMDHDADTADVAFPAAELLVQGRDGYNLTITDRQQREVSAQVNVLTPIMDDGWIGHSMFDEHSLACGYREEELVERHLVRTVERTHQTTEPAL